MTTNNEQSIYRNPPPQLNNIPIYKKTLSINEQIFIRNELMVKPYIPTSPIQLPSYPIYRESNNKFYVPRFFGINMFGVPNISKINNKS